MKDAFTMIETIFVIVIIGILSAIALPKLAAMRSDAEGAVIVNSLTTCIDEAGNKYMLTGSFHHLTQEDNITVNCRRANKCFNFTESDSNGSLTIVADTSEASKACLEAQRIAEQNLLATTHTINF